MLKDYISFDSKTKNITLSQSVSKRSEGDFHQMKVLQKLIKDRLFADEITKRVIKKEILNVDEFYNLIDAHRYQDQSQITSTK